MIAVRPRSSENHSNRPEKPSGQKTCQAKNAARLRITPTTAAVMPVSGAVNCRLPCVDSTSGPPRRMNRKEGRKVKNVATAAPAHPASASASGPSTAFVQAPTKPTKATTMMSGPGVVAPGGELSRSDASAEVADDAGAEHDVGKRNAEGEDRHERRQADGPQHSILECS